MGLVYRKGRPYLYKRVRRGGKVTSEYVASGTAAVLIARLETIERDKRDYEGWAADRRCREFDEVDSALDDLCRRTQALAADALTKTGYHRHHRGVWRKRRDDRNREAGA